MTKLLLIAHIQAVVAAYYGIPTRDIVAADKHKQFIIPRQVAMYLAYEMTSKSLLDIGRRFHKHHTTIIHAIRAIQGRLLSDAELDLDIQTLRGRLATHSSEFIPTIPRRKRSQDDLADKAKVEA